MQQVKPKKALGQHFLTDERVAKRISETLGSYNDTPVLEVGPGMGVLTKYLIESHEQLKVVEIDGESVEYLREHYPGLKVIESDFLEMDLSTVFGAEEKICVIGNYPYNISSQIFFKVLDYKDSVVCCSGMLQKEVAERIAAGPGSKVYGILSVLLQAWYEVEYLFTVEAEVFNPPPKVKSGVIRLIRNNVTDLGCDERQFKKVVKTSFGQRRKMLRSSLKVMFPPGAEELGSELFTKRPEQLNVQEFVEITNMVTKYRNQE